MEKKIFSWLIDGDMAVKEIDKSVVEHHGTGIPNQTRNYWDINNMKNGEKKHILLILDGQVFNAHIEMRDNRTRLFWQTDFRDAAGFHLFSDEEARKLLKPYLLFTRIDHEKYSVELISQGEEYEKAKTTSEKSSCYVEGGKKVYYSTKYERNAKCRQEAIRIHGCKCKVCGFDFKNVYGELGSGYIEIHHKKPLHSLDDEEEVNPVTDLVPVCSNCHRMLHRRRDRIITVDELKNIISNYRLPTINI